MRFFRPGRTRDRSGSPSLRRRVRVSNSWKWRMQVGTVMLVSLLATGVHWDAAQVFAWGRMFSRYSETMTMAQAAKRTFSGEMCSLCKAVNSAKQQEQKAPMAPSFVKAKFVMVCLATPALVFARPDRVVWTHIDPPVVSLGRSAPPSPPPRGRVIGA